MVEDTEKVIDNRSFLVIGPESSGTRVTARILIENGCLGSYDHDQEFDSYIPPPSNKPILIRRSFPHNGAKPDLAKLVADIVKAGYSKPLAVICIREELATCTSSVLAGHRKDIDLARIGLEQAYAEIFAQIARLKLKIFVSTIEGLHLGGSTAQEYLVRRLDLPKSSIPSTIPIYNSNIKHYGSADVAGLANLSATLDVDNWRELLVVSPVVNYLDFITPTFRSTLLDLGLSFKFHRKAWENYILTLFYRDYKDRFGLSKPLKTIGFGVGTERFTAVIAGLKDSALISNLDNTDKRVEKLWRNQYLTGLYPDGVQCCTFYEWDNYVSITNIDMKNIPDEYLTEDYDFSWSCSSMEHLGSIDAAIDFFVQQMRCLKPGGIAVHTTELLVTRSKEPVKTLTSGDVVLLRPYDIARLASKLADINCELYPIDTREGNTHIDLFVDTPPYKADYHLKLNVGGFVTTSIALVARKLGSLDSASTN